MRTGSLSHFRTRYRNVGLIVDDIHFLAAKRATQDEFLHTFNTLIDKGAPIVLASDHHPRLISRLTDELMTRFLGGMVVKIEQPDLATRRAILQARATAHGVDVPDTVITYIAEHLRLERARAQRCASHGNGTSNARREAARPQHGEDRSSRHNPPYISEGGTTRRRAAWSVNFSRSVPRR